MDARPGPDEPARRAAPPPPRLQTRGEELANSVSHGVAALLAALGLPVLVAAAGRDGSVPGIVGAGVFGATLLLLYLASTLYHALPRGRAKDVLHVLDHSAIFLLIAGTYTPFTLNVLPDAWGWTMLGLVWALAVAGIVLKVVPGRRRPGLSLALYLGMGWLIVIAAKPLWLNLPRPGLWWLLGGGLAYTAGAALYSIKRLRYGHFVWHLFVMAGSACHCVAVLCYAL